MEITKRFDTVTGGWTLECKRGRRRLKAMVWFSVKLDDWVLAGDCNGSFGTMGAAARAFEAYCQDPDRNDPGRPLTVAETCMEIPRGIDPADLLESPRVRGRKDAGRAARWAAAKMLTVPRRSDPRSDSQARH